MASNFGQGFFLKPIKACGIVVQFGTCLGKLKSAGMPLEQRHLQMLLELVNPLAHCSLSDGQFASHCRETAQLGCSSKRFQMRKPLLPSPLVGHNYHPIPAALIWAALLI
jgi:hypothetical protein